MASSGCFFACDVPSCGGGDAEGGVFSGPEAKLRNDTRGRDMLWDFNSVDSKTAKEGAHSDKAIAACRNRNNVDAIIMRMAPLHLSSSLYLQYTIKR